MTAPTQTLTGVKRVFAPQRWTKLYQYGARSYQCLTLNPELFWMRKFARIEPLRAWVRQSSVDSSYLLRDMPQGSIFNNLEVDAIVARIKTHSFSAGLQLPVEMVGELVDYAYTAPFYGDRNPDFELVYGMRSHLESQLGQSFKVGSFSRELHPAILQLAQDPGLLAIAAQYFQASPKYIASELLWSFPAESTLEQQLKAAQVFHCDIDDYCSLKFFFYLTDVDDNSGPHVCIQGTHNGKRLRHQLLGQRCASIPDEALMRDYGIENTTTITGPAGFGFVEDPLCFHKGTRPQNSPRLMLQIQYAVNEYGDLRNFL